MRSRLVSAWLIVLVLLPLGAGCGAQKVEGSLGQALAMFPADVETFSFTDWALLKTSAGFPDLGSASPAEERRAFWTAVARKHAPGVSFGRAPDSMAATWGWDNSDLVWAAAAWNEAGLVAYVLEFGRDLAPIQERYLQYGFEPSEYQGVMIYSHKPSFREDWYGDADSAVVNTAVLPEDRVLVMGGELANVQAVLDVLQGRSKSLAGDANTAAVAGRLEQMASATIIPVVGSNCPSVGIRAIQRAQVPLPPETLKRLQAAVAEVEVRRFESFGLGYRYEGEELLGLVVLHYGRAGDAQADLEVRKKLAVEGPMLSSRTATYGDTFALQDAAAVGSDLLFWMSPKNDQPGRLFALLTNRDMLFAACP